MRWSGQLNYLIIVGYNHALHYMYKTEPIVDNESREFNLNLTQKTCQNNAADSSRGTSRRIWHLSGIWKAREAVPCRSWQIITSGVHRRFPDSTMKNDGCYYFPRRAGKIQLPLFVFRGVRARIVASTSCTIGKLELEWNLYATQRCDAITRPFANEQMMNGRRVVGWIDNDGTWP